MQRRDTYTSSSFGSDYRPSRYTKKLTTIKAEVVPLPAHRRMTFSRDGLHDRGRAGKLPSSVSVADSSSLSLLNRTASSLSRGTSRTSHSDHRPLFSASKRSWGSCKQPWGTILPPPHFDQIRNKHMTEMDFTNMVNRLSYRRHHSPMPEVIIKRKVFISKAHLQESARRLSTLPKHKRYKSNEVPESQIYFWQKHNFH